ALATNGALVSFVRYKHVAAADSAPTRFLRGNYAYAAFVVAPGDSVPNVVRLGDVWRIDSLVARWRERVMSRGDASSAGLQETLERQEGEKLRRAVWEPVLQ